MRLFIALIPKQETLSQIRDVVRGLGQAKRNFNYIAIDQLHMSLKFVGGNISEDSLKVLNPVMKERFKGVNLPEVTLTDLSYGTEGQKAPKVMFFSVEPNAELDQLTQQIHELVVELGLEDVVAKKDRKRHIHHVTVARVKRSISNSLVRNTRNEIEQASIKDIKFIPAKLALVQSVLTPQGPFYKVLDVYS